MKCKKEIAILLPNKEDYTKNNAAAASIWVKDFNENELCSKTIIFGNCSNNKPLSKNFINLKENRLINSSYFYLQSFSRKIPSSIRLIEIHNRPHFFLFLKKKIKNCKFILIFHNNPNTLRGCTTVAEKKYILENCDELVFVSKYVKNKFYENLINFLPIGKIIYPAISYKKLKYSKKKNIIIFCGKLNRSKGYNIFGPALIKILNKYKNWEGVVAGSEKREFYDFSHKRLKIYNWLSHDKIINLYKKTSISVVPSLWEEPFGRTAMESSDLGNAVITSGFGGLKETSFKPIVIKDINYKKIFLKIDELIRNKEKLTKINKFNFYNRKINFNENLNILISIKKGLLETKISKINIHNKTKNVLHISNFDERSNYRLANINIANKISNGFIKNNIQVFNFSDRYFQAKNNFISIDRKILEIVKNIRPDLLLLGHTNSIKLETLEIVKKVSPETKISFWYEDSINKLGPDFFQNKIFVEKYKKLVDKFFITTSPDEVQAEISKNKLNFLPIPCSEFTENFNLHKFRDFHYDLFYAVSHGVNRGILKKNKIDERFKFIKELTTKGNDLSFKIFGFNNNQPIWGNDLINEISKCRFGLNLSRGGPVKHYSSNRIATLMGNGIPTIIDEKIQYQDFFTKNELITYKNIDDLISKIKFYKKNERARINLGIKGKSKYFKIFNNEVIADYIFTRSLNINSKKKFYWE
jgi:glycosyltransferase involved in cell wall biosynthesis